MLESRGTYARLHVWVVSCLCAFCTLNQQNDDEIPIQVPFVSLGLLIALLLIMCRGNTVNLTYSGDLCAIKLIQKLENGWKSREGSYQKMWHLSTGG